MRTAMFSLQKRLLRSIAILHAERAITAVLFTCTSLGLFAQLEEKNIVLEGQFSVDWLPEDHPAISVGHLAPRDGFWLDEIPWNVFEAKLPNHWPAAQDLVTQPNWLDVDSTVLTIRQRQLLREYRDTDELSWDFVQGDYVASAQIQTPVMRFNSERDQFERLNSVEFALGMAEGFADQIGEGGFQRMRNWPSTSPLANGDFIRISLPEDGVYRIGRDWIQAAGYDPDTLDPRRMRIFGNGGSMLPTDPAEERA